MKINLPTLLFGFIALAPPAALANPQTIDEALQLAVRQQLPVFADFQAQWCYSCYFMDTHVLNGTEWSTLAKRVVTVEVDADSPDGARWMKQLKVKVLPSYVVLRADGAELGRVVGEQPREKFYPQMEKILGGSDALDALKGRVAGGSDPTIADVLASYDARGEFEQGLDWYAGLPSERRATAEKDAKVAMWQERLGMERAAKAEDHTACIAAGKKVLAANIGCDRYYVLESLLDCSEKLSPSARTSLLSAQLPALDELMAKQVFVQPPQCADQRTAVLTAADLNKAIGDSKAEAAVLDRAIIDARRRLGDNLAQDRNLADNLRVYLTRAERYDELDALMPKLMAAYPDDYVYAFRFGTSLLNRKKPAEALPYLEQAAEKSFGANRLAVATARVKALLALNRRADAEKVVADALEANGPWFPEQAAKLKAALKS
jgi:Thioredoxin-like